MKRMAAALLLTLLALVRAGGAGESEPDFYFVQITDTHVGEHPENARRLARVVDYVNRLPVPLACVVVTGDITTDLTRDPESVKRAKALFAPLKAPVHYLAGNHDILKQDHAAWAAAYREAFGPLNHEAEYHGVRFLFVCTEPLSQDYPPDGGDPLVWLEQKLAASEKPALVFHHWPSVRDLYVTATKTSVSAGWREPLRTRWVDLLNRHGVKAVIAGHFHRDEHHWLGNVPLYVGAPVAERYGRQATFRLYEYKHGRLGYRTQYIGE